MDVCKLVLMSSQSVIIGGYSEDTIVKNLYETMSSCL